MISVCEASRRIGASIQAPHESELCQLTNSLGRILASSVHSDREQPPFDRVAMDGIAVSFHDVQNQIKSFSIKGIHPAGQPAPELTSGEQQCYEVMTGAVLPVGTDVVIPYENITISGDRAHWQRGFDVQPFDNVHRKGGDAEIGKCVLRAGDKIGLDAINALASVGLYDLPVFRKPQIALFTSGDEIVPVTEKPRDFQIRRSNGPTIEVLLKAKGFDLQDDVHLRDERKMIFSHLEKALDTRDVVIITGGVSKGKFDFIPAALADLKVERVFHGVYQRPGKPFWFGVSQSGTLVFGLPGNPLSAMITARRFLIPALHAFSGGRYDEDTFKVRLTEDVHFSKPLTLFKTVQDLGGGSVQPISTHGSGDYMSLIGTSGFVELTRDKEVFDTRGDYDYYPW